MAMNKIQAEINISRKIETLAMNGSPVAISRNLPAPGVTVGERGEAGSNGVRGGRRHETLRLVEPTLQRCGEASSSVVFNASGRVSPVPVRSA
jgi:hypothetical protein